MDRRKFFVLGVTGAVAISLPVSQCSTRDVTDRPEFLQSLTGKKQIMEIGRAYLEKFPSEANKQKLSLLIKVPGEQSASAIDTRIQNEFQKGKIVVVNGWVLSVTEARQSALYFLNSSS